MLHPITERIGDERGVITEVLSQVAIRPSANVFERLRKIPMIKRHPRLDISLEHLVDDAIIKVETALINRTLAERHDPRPRERDSRRVQAKVSHQRDVVFVPMVKIASDVAAVAMLNLAGRVRETIPNRLALTVLVPPALNLVGSASRPPQKSLRKSNRRHSAVC